ncbi:MAG: TrkH family potassium uptake protein [Acholeplasmataceae bacterium]|nr:TrkH family potassium uptake protein [Acholeplasmataceae bacterium]
MNVKKSISGYPLIINYLGIFSILIGLIILIPLAVLPFYPEEFVEAKYFFIPALSSIVIGGLIVIIFKGREKERLERSQDAILVMSIWILAIFISSLPFVLTGNYNFTQAIFESTSGYSTTGLTVVDVTVTPNIFLFFRSLLQFVGGVGLVLVLTSAISDKFGMRLYSAEGHSDKLVPNLIKSGRMILSIYIGYILVGTVFLIIFGMTPFEAINHSITAVATGGFSTEALSIGAFNSVGVEVTIMILMLLGGTNFFVHLMLLRGKFKNVFKHVEIKLLGLLLLIFIPMLVVNLFSMYDGNFFYTLRVASFQFISAVTGTGFQTIDTFTIMPPTFITVLIIVMVLGAGMGSTAGGMKQYRVALAFKSLYWNIREQFGHKKTIRTHFINKIGTKTIVSKDEIVQNHSFLMIYLLALFTGALIFTGFGYSIRDSLFEFSSALGTVGLSVGIVGYNANPIILWTSTVGMFLGRLEFYVVFIAITKIFLDLKKKA